PRSQFLIDGRQSFLRIDDEDRDCGDAKRDLSFGPDLLEKSRIDARADPAGVDDRERRAAESALRGNAVARHARLVVDDGNHAPRKAIEERRLADVWPADDGDSAGHLK